jgi:hypothetical protein
MSGANPLVEEHFELIATVVSSNVITHGIGAIAPVRWAASPVGQVHRHLAGQAEVEHGTKGSDVNPWITLVAPGRVSLSEGQEFIAEPLACLCESLPIVTAVE